MKTIVIKKVGSEFQYKELATTSTGWNYFPREVRTAAQMKQYFADGRQSWQPNQNWRDVELQLVDINNKSYNHYSVTQNDKFHQAVVNYDDSKKMMFTAEELWPAAERINYLCSTAVFLPSEFHHNIDGALTYLKENELFTVIDFEKQLQQKIKDKITEHCEQHARQSESYADVEFTD